MFVKYEGMKAYLDIEIKAKEESLFSSSGGEEDTDDDNSLFSSSGGEESDSRTEIQQNNQFQQKCNDLVDLIVWSLNRHDADSAQSYTNQAVALGCDINTAKVDQVVAQIHDIEKAEEQQRERDEQQQAQQQTVPPLPQNQTNWGNVMNILVQGMQHIQPGNNNPAQRPSSGSKPLPTAGSVWQSYHPQVDTQNNGAAQSNGAAQNNGAAIDYDRATYNRILDSCRKGSRGLSMTYANNRSKSLSCEELANYRGYGICPSWAIKCKGRRKH